MATVAVEASRFEGLPKAILLAISKLSGDDYRDVDGDELLAELREVGQEPASDVAFLNVMRQLKNSAYIECSLTMGGVDLIRLDERGLQLVEGWPTPGALDIEPLLRMLDARSEDETLPEPERHKARAAVRALRDLGTPVLGEVIASFVKSLSGMP